MNNTQLLKTALACAVTLGMGSVASVALAQKPMMKMTPQMIQMQQQKTMAMMKKDRFVKAYGINAAFKNDCKSPGHSCAGQDSHARDPNAFVAIPAGLCAKIAGCSLTAG